MIELLYFKSERCLPCSVLLEKVKSILFEDFHNIKLTIIDVDENPEVSGQSLVFTIPLIIAKKDNKEFFRFSAYGSMDQLKEKLANLVSLQTEFVF